MEAFGDELLTRGPNGMRPTPRALALADPLRVVLSSIEALVSPHDPEQRLVVYTAQPGSPTAATLPVLASWGFEAPVRPIP